MALRVATKPETWEKLVVNLPVNSKGRYRKQAGTAVRFFIFDGADQRQA